MGELVKAIQVGGVTASSLLWPISFPSHTADGVAARTTEVVVGGRTDASREDQTVSVGVTAGRRGPIVTSVSGII